MNRLARQMISFCLGKDKKNSGEIGFKFNHLGMKIHKTATKKPDK
jgi:hypothetical protein